jgi:hypothetical protein
MNPLEGQFTFHMSQKDGGWQGSHTFTAKNKEQALGLAQSAAGDKYTIHALHSGTGLKQTVVDNYKYGHAEKE